MDSNPHLILIVSLLMILSTAKAHVNNKQGPGGADDEGDKKVCNIGLNIFYSVLKTRGITYAEKDWVQLN